MQIITFASAPDPYPMPTADIVGNLFNTQSYRTPVQPQAIVPGENTAVWLAIGQSTGACNNDDTQYSVTNPKSQNFNCYDGAIYSADTPMLGCQGFGGNWNSRACDDLNASSGNQFQRVICAPVGVGGTTIAQWQPTGGVLWQRIVSAKARLDSRGLTPTFITWMQGETDNVLGTSQAAYTASFADLVSGIRALGYNMPIFISRTTLQGGVTSSAVRAAQAAAVNNGAGIYAGPDTDTITGATYRQAGGNNAHFTGAGSALCSSLWVPAIDAVF